jgi:alpha-mannosidase
VSDKARGLMIANRGLPEYEVLTEADATATIALTLLRCVSWLSRDDLPERPGHAGPGMYTPGAQMIGRWRFEYSIIPHKGLWSHGFAEAHRFARPLRAVRASGGSGEWPREKALLSIDNPAAVMSAVKLAEDDDSTAVRVYNIGDVPGEVTVRLGEAFGKVRRVDLNEENSQPLLAVSGRVRMKLGPNEITTLRFKGPKP